MPQTLSDLEGQGQGQLPKMTDNNLAVAETVPKTNS